MTHEATPPRFTFLPVLCLVALALLVVTVIANWPELRDTFRPAPAGPSNPTGRH